MSKIKAPIALPEIVADRVMRIRDAVREWNHEDRQMRLHAERSERLEADLNFLSSKSSLERVLDEWQERCSCHGSPVLANRFAEIRDALEDRVARELKDRWNEQEPAEQHQEIESE